MCRRIKTEMVKLKKLIYVQDIFKKILIMEILKQNGISAISKSVNLGSAFGYSMLGEELYVKEIDYEPALEILQELEKQEVDFDELEKLAASFMAKGEEENENDNSLHKQHRKYVIKFILVFAIAIVIGIYSDPVIKWHDETLRWIIAQELNKNSEDDIRISDVSKITELYLEAEEIKNLKDLRYFYNLRVLELKTPEVDNLNPIKNLTYLDKLVLCGLDIKTLDSLNRLHLTDVTIQDIPLLSIESLSRMKGLQKLKLQGIPISSMQPIAKVKSLEMLDLEDMVITDLEVLKDLPNLSSISIKRVKTLYAISLNEFERYQNVSLSGLEVEGRINSQYINTLSLEDIDLKGKADWIHTDSLKHLTLNNCQIKDLAVLHGLVKLESLNINGNSIQSIDGLKDFTQLKALSLANNPIDDLSPISALKNLEMLDLSGIGLEGQENYISDMNLRKLRLSNCNITEIHFLQGQEELIWLDLSRNMIEDIEPLRIYRKGLKYLDISENPIRDLTPLSEWFVFDPGSVEEGAELNISGIKLGGMGKEQLNLLNLKKLYARNCGIKDIEFIRVYENLQFLDVSNNHIKYFDPMLSIPHLREVNAKGNLITEGYLLYGVNTNLMRETAMQLSPGIYGCPADWKNHFIEDKSYKNTWFRITID